MTPKQMNDQDKALASFQEAMWSATDNSGLAKAIGVAMNAKSNSETANVVPVMKEMFLSWLGFAVCPLQADAAKAWPKSL